jgi:ABC-type nitrate/sulfonate/bicarbonate transport system substrate-binding protein
MAVNAQAFAQGASRGVLFAVRQYAPAALLLAALVLFWEGWVRAFDTKDYFLPAPTAIWSSFTETADLLPPHIRTTMTEAVVGLLVAAVAGVVLAVLIASVPLVRRVLYPLLIVSQTIPMIVLAPLLIIWFGFGLTPKIVVVALIGFFPIVVATTDALMRADPDMVGLVRSMGANRWQVLRNVLIGRNTGVLQRPADRRRLCRDGSCHRRVDRRQLGPWPFHRTLAHLVPDGPGVRGRDCGGSREPGSVRRGERRGPDCVPLDVRTRNGGGPMTRFRLRLMPLLTLALVMAPMVAVCGDDDDDNGDLESVTLMLNWTPNTHHNGIYVAKEKGWYEDAGLDVRIIEPGQNVVEQAVASGNADFGISIQEAVIPARAEGLPVVSIGTIIQHNDSSLFSLASENIQRPRDLAGKKYGGFGGALENALIKELVACDGGDPDEVEFVEVGNVDYVVGMEQDRFDFAWVFESWDVMRAREILNADTNSIKFVDYLDCIPDWYTPLFITTESMIAERPDTVRRFMEATAQGYEFAIETGPGGRGAAQGAPESDRELVEKSSAYMAHTSSMRAANGASRTRRSGSGSRSTSARRADF